MTTAALDGARVLLLEDEFLIAMDVEQLCRDHGADEVAIVRSLSETQGDGFDFTAYDVAIIDVMLGGISSLSFAQRLRERRVPFIFASGYPDADEAFSTFPEVDVVNKPYASEELLSAVSRAMKSRPLADGSGNRAAKDGAAG